MIVLTDERGLRRYPPDGALRDDLAVCKELFPLMDTPYKTTWTGGCETNATAFARPTGRRPLLAGPSGA